MLEQARLINSVKDLLEINDSFHYRNAMFPQKCIYRGLKQYDYPLTPGIGRLLNENLTKEKLLEIEKSILNEFKIASYNELKATDDFILMTTAQHHGLKTRLLDWSLSPLVALFFAVEVDDKKSGAIVSYRVNEKINDFGNAKSIFDFKELNDYHFVYAPSISPRLKAQNSIFQYFKDPTLPFDSESHLLKFKIPANRKTFIKRELHDLGITYASLFPDLEGLCKSINYDKFGS